MAPSAIEYLAKRGVPCELVHHHTAIPARELAATLHLTGDQLAKPVLLWADDRLWMAVIPATRRLDEQLVQLALDVQSTHLAREEEFSDRFPDCEVGAEPPIGSLFGIPVVMDERLASFDFIYFRAGTHEDVVRVPYADFVKLERPKIAEISHAPSQRRWEERWQWKQPAGHPDTL